MIAKRFKTYVSLGYFGLSSREVDYSLGNNHVLREKEFKFPYGAT
jgi:hypothetical protein